MIALSLERERKHLRWTQERTVTRLAEFGLKWSRVNYAMSISTSLKGRRTREFNADEITAFAQTFGVAVWTFFVPPSEALVRLPGGGPTLSFNRMRFLASGRDMRRIAIGRK
jgi:hypothetical protein